MSKFKIYGLIVKGNNTIRYVGYTKRTIEQRLASHFSDTKTKTYKKCRWITKHNFNIDIVLIEDNLTYEQALIREKYWIAFYDTFYNGMNGTLGGDSNPMESEEVRAKHKEAMSKLNGKAAHYGNDNWMTTEAGKKWFSENNPMRNQEAYNKSQVANKANKIVIDKDELKKKYIDENKTIKECADIFEVTYKSVVKNLSRYNIKKYNYEQCNTI